MIEIPGITIHEEVSQGYRSVLYRGCDDYSLPLLIKVYKIDAISSPHISQFKQKFNIILNIKSEGFVKAKNIKFCNNDLAIVMEDFSGIFLNDFIINGNYDIKKLIDIFIQLARAVGDMHDAGIIHKELNPKNILINEESGTVKIIDYGFASFLTQENEQIYLSEILKDNLTYISPEQTGRMNRTMDYRTDFYSLGIIFYELLTGSVPFYSNNPLNLFHSHIARLPKTPFQHRTDIPKVISEIIMKLMAKDPDERYQSGFGFISDLKECRAQIENKGWIEPFVIGKDDISKKLIISQKIYGRDDEIKKLITSFERVCIGKSELMLVKGYSGIGKNVLINEMHKPVVEHSGYFLWGKFDQLRINMPYHAIAQAFQGLMRQLLTESKDRITLWKKRLKEALGGNGKIITDVIPEVELLTGKQPEVPKLGADEAQARFNIVFQDFVRVFPTKDHPMVLFLDDLQWIDSASLDLIKILITYSSIQYILFICAFRDNEITPIHRLSVWLDDIDKTNIEYNQILLQPLSPESIHMLITDTLKHSPDVTDSLSKVIYKKTGGNPFFVKQFLKMLTADKILTFSAGSGWKWNIDKITEIEETDNVVDLMTKKMLGLPEEQLIVLKTASCFGYRFTLEALAECYGKTTDETYANLSDSLKNGLMLLMQDTYRFSHDRIQETAYSLIPEEKKKKLHYKIGKIFLKQTEANKIFENVFDIVNQLNLGMEFITNQEEKKELATLNLSAGQKAKASSAYEVANQYLEMGIELLQQNAWEKEYDLTLSLYSEIVEVKYIIRDTKQAERFFNKAVKEATTLLDRIRLYEIKIATFIVLMQSKEAFDLGIEALSMLGMNMSTEAGLIELKKEMDDVKQKIGDREIEKLIDLPVLNAPLNQSAMRILMLTVIASYTTNPEYLPILSLRLINLSLEHGNTIASPYAYVTFGVIVLCGNPGDIELGYRFGRLALKVVDKLNANEVKAKIYFIFGDMISHWKHHYREGRKHLLEAFNSGSESGDLTFASYGLVKYICIYPFSWEHLSKS